MSSSILNYIFDGRIVSNPDGTSPVTLPETAELVPGPGIWSGLYLPKAVKLRQSGPLLIDLRAISVPLTKKFRAGIIFRYDGEVPQPGAPYPPQILFLSYFIPFQLELVLSEGRLRIRGGTTVTNSSLRQQTSFTQLYELTGSTIPAIVPGEWYSADVVWDQDKNILVTFLNGIAVSCHGFGPDNRVHVTGRVLLLGGHDDSNPRRRFDGAIAGVTLELGVSSSLMDLQLQKQKETPLYFITTKLEILRPEADLQDPVGQPTVSNSGRTSIQEFRYGRISFTNGDNEAFGLYGEFWSSYRELTPEIKRGLGYERSDIYFWIEPDPIRNLSGRCVTFSNGELITSTSPGTGIFAIFGIIARSRSLDSGIKRWGFPLENQQAVRSGFAQKFDHGCWYYKLGTGHAYGLYENLYWGYEKAGGPEKNGLPISNEEQLGSIRIKGTPGSEWDAVVYKVELEGDATIWWCSATGAYIVSGLMRAQWNSQGHVYSYYGPPASAEIGIPSSDPSLHLKKRMQSFMRGILIVDPERIAFQNLRQFGLKITTINTLPEPTERGQKNDLYLRVDADVRLLDSSGTPTGDGYKLFTRRYPDGDTVWRDQNERVENINLPVNFTPHISREYVLKVVAVDRDGISPTGMVDLDDVVGQGTVTLSKSTKSYKI